MKNPLFKPKTFRARTLAEKCEECRDQLKNVGDDGSALINPSFVWCRGCKNAIRLNQLGKLHNFKSQHLVRHHPGLGGVLTRKDGATLDRMANGLDVTAAVAASGPTRLLRKMSKAT